MTLSIRTIAASETPNQALIEHCPMPGHFYVDIGNICNLRCPFCVTGAKTTQGKRHMMSFAEFEVIFERIKPYAKLISLYNWGEPFLNRSLIPKISLAASGGARVHIDTNLTVGDLSDAQCHEIVESGLYSLFASIDGVSQETYQKYRVRGKISRVFANLERLIAAKKSLGTPFPILGWQYHVHALNEDEMDAAEQKARELDIGIVFKRLNAPDTSWHSSIHWDGFMVLKGEDWFRQTYAPPQTPGFNSSFLDPAVRSPCSQLFGTMTIDPNGDVMPCTCVEGNAYAMGNLHQSSLEDIWNNSAFAQSRRFIIGYGPRQNGQSICETLECPLVAKCLPDSASDVD